ncbi:MAG: DUF4115 domain-containing protein [Bryobacteraceae bacterium]|nr:DUF4115 domain-containing protein [Bryobacteraceae bacterium]
MASLGERLRKARESQGRKLSEIADETRIHTRYLAAIEAEDWDTIPGGFFRKSFVQQFAHSLGIPEGEIEPDLKALAEKEGPPLIPGQEPRREGTELPPIALSIPTSRNGYKLLGGLVALAAVLAGCAALYSVWLNQQQPGGMQELARRETPPPAPNTRTGARSTERPAAPAPANAEPAAEMAGAPRQVQAEGPLWIMIEAKESTWVRITSGNQHLFSGVLEPNETKRLYGLENARLVVGNAGGLEILSNGKPIGPIGNRGQVRVILITPEGAEISTPKPKPSASAPEASSSLGA